jgi:hypothetical protein
MASSASSVESAMTMSICSSVRASVVIFAACRRSGSMAMISGFVIV